MTANQLVSDGDYEAGPFGRFEGLEFAGLGPAPFCGMLLADLGADVVCIDRIETRRTGFDAYFRGRRSVALNLKKQESIETCLRLAEGADGLIGLSPRRDGTAGPWD